MPHYFEMTLPDGQKRHCGTMRDVESILSIYPDAVYHKVLLPPVPQTVDVPHVIELPGNYQCNKSYLNHNKNH